MYSFYSLDYQRGDNPYSQHVNRPFSEVRVISYYTRPNLHYTSWTKKKKKKKKKKNWGRKKEKTKHGFKHSKTEEVEIWHSLAFSVHVWLLQEPSDNPKQLPRMLGHRFPFLWLRLSPDCETFLSSSLRLNYPIPLPSNDWPALRPGPECLSLLRPEYRWRLWRLLLNGKDALA